MIRVVVCDTFPILLHGMREILHAASDIEIVATANGAGEALASVRRHDPDVLLTDLWLRDSTGVEVAKTLAAERRRTRVVVITNHLSDADTVQALRYGVRGIVTMQMLPAQIITAIRSVHAGHTWLEMQASQRTLGRLLQQDVALAAYAQALTPQELAISRLAAQGLNNRDIADRIGIREGTVKLHLHHVYRKLGVGNRVELVLHAREKALI